MERFEFRLEAGEKHNKGQTRVVNIDAPSFEEAEKLVIASEEDIARFTLAIPDEETWNLPRHKPEGEDSPNAHVDLSRWDAHDSKWARAAADLSYKDAAKAANKRLSDFSDRIVIDKRGKVRGKKLTGREAARFVAHLQSEPYAIVDSRKIDAGEIERQQAVQALAMATHDKDAWAKEISRLQNDGPTAVVTALLAGLPWLKQIDGSSVTVFSSAAIQTSLHTALTFGTTQQDTFDFFDDVSASEITGTGYTVKGVTAGSKASTYSTTLDQIQLDYADSSWTTSTLSATDAMIWVDTGGASSTDPIWGNVDFGATVTTTAGTFLITWDATGVIVYDIT